MQSFKDFVGKMRRYWLIALIVMGVVAIVSIYTYQPAQTVYRIETNYLVSHDPLDSTLDVEEERYYHWVMSEYVTYSLSDWIQGTDFAERVSERISADYGADMEIDQVSGAVSSGAIRSRLIVAYASLDKEEAELVAAAGYAELLDVDNEGLDVPQFQLSKPRVRPLDPEFSVQEINPTLSQIFALPIRIAGSLLSGLLAAVFLAFRDPIIDSRHSLRLLNLPVLGEIPST